MFAKSLTCAALVAGSITVGLATSITVALAASGNSARPHEGPPVCCVPPPRPGQLDLQSYRFTVDGQTGSLFALMGIVEPQGTTLRNVYLDATPLTPAAGNFAVWCGLVPVGTWHESACSVSATFGPAMPPPPSGSMHTLKIVESTGASYAFTVRAGAGNGQPQARLS